MLRIVVPRIWGSEPENLLNLFCCGLGSSLILPGGCQQFIQRRQISFDAGYDDVCVGAIAPKRPELVLFTLGADDLAAGVTFDPDGHLTDCIDAFSYRVDYKLQQVIGAWIMASTAL